MAASWKTVRVFISSTFRDMHAERDVLVTVVFPELRERLERLGLEFFDVDLRWGVPQTGVDGERANSWAYCKQWIERVEPFFVCMLGQRYGWVPPADDIRDPDDRAAYEGMSITEMEVRHAVLSGKHRRRSFFYLRETKVPKDATPDDIYENFVDIGEQPRLKTLKKAIREKSGRPVRDYPSQWTGAGFSELDKFGEMVLEDLWSGVLRDERYVSKDVWRTFLGHDPDRDPIYTDDSAPIPRETWECVVEQAKPVPADPLDAEAAEMAAFAAGRLRWFQGRANELQELRFFIDGTRPEDASRVCVVRAIAGAGKSALLAKLAEDLATSSHLVITHFVGATERSADVRSLLKRLVEELDRHGIPHPEEPDLKEDLASLKTRFASRLETYRGDLRIVLLIDGINQLTYAHDLSWLPQRLGDSVRMVLSCIDDPSARQTSPHARVMAALERRAPVPEWVRLRALGDADVREIVDAFLLEYCKELDPQEMETIAGMEQARNPLYLLVMLHELRTLGGQDMHLKVRDIIADLPTLCPDTVTLFDWMLQRLEVFGGEPVRRWWGYLGLSRVGMSGLELSELLGRTLGDEGTRAARRIERSVRRYLQHRGAQWDFYHGQLREAVRHRYLRDDPAHLHVDVADYFDARWRKRDPHALSEQPFHLASAGRWGAYSEVMLAPSFLEFKLDAFDIYALLEDCDLAKSDVSALPEGVQSPVAALRDALLSSVHVLNADKHQLHSQLLGRLLGHSHPLIQRLCSAPVALLTPVWLRPIRQALRRAGGPLIATLTGHSAPVRTIALSDDGRLAVSGSRDASLRVWDLAWPSCIHTLVGHTEEVNVVILANTIRGTIAVSGSGSRRPFKPHIYFPGAVEAIEHGPAIDTTIRLWDIKDGVELDVLRGHSGAVRSLTCARGWLFSGSDDGVIRIWDLEQRVGLGILGNHGAPVLLLTFFKGALLSVSEHVFRLWDVGGRTVIHEGRGDLHWDHILAVDAERLRFAIQQQSLNGDRYNLYVSEPDGSELRNVTYFESAINVAKFTDEGRQLVVGGADTTLRLINVDSGDKVAAFHGHGDEVTCVDVSSSSRRMVTGSSDGTLALWALDRPKEDDGRPGHSDDVNAVAVSADGALGVSASHDGSIALWDTSSGACLTRVKGHARDARAVAFDNTGSRLLSASSDRTVRLWLLPGVEEVSRLTGHKEMVTCVAFIGDQSCAVSGSADGTLKTWELSSGQELRTFEGHQSGIRALACLHHTNAVVSGDEQGELICWNIDTGERLFTVDRYCDSAASERLKQKPYDVPTGFHWRPSLMQRSVPAVESLAVSADDRYLFVAMRQRPILVWDVEKRQERGALAGHSGLVFSISADGDGRRMVSAGDDRMIRVWNLATGQTECVFTADSPIYSCALSTDGRFVLAGEGGRAGKVLFLRVEGSASSSSGQIFEAPPRPASVAGTVRRVSPPVDPRALAKTLYERATQAKEQGALEEALTLSREAERLWQDVGVKDESLRAQALQADVLHAQGDMDAAMALIIGVLKEQEATAREHYEAQVRRWKAIPWWKRWRLPKPTR